MLLLLLHIRALVPHTTLHPSTIARTLYRPFFVNLKIHSHTEAADILTAASSHTKHFICADRVTPHIAGYRKPHVKAFPYHQTHLTRPLRQQHHAPSNPSSSAFFTRQTELDYKSTALLSQTLGVIQQVRILQEPRGKRRWCRCLTRGEACVEARCLASRTVCLGQTDKDQPQQRL